MNDIIGIVFDIFLALLLYFALKEISLNRIRIQALERKLKQLTEKNKNTAESENNT